MPKVIPITIKVPTAEDYKYVPKEYMCGRPLLSGDKLLKKPNGIKRLHDWYMRASSAGIDTISICIPEKAFLSKTTKKCMLTIEDVWAMMNLERLDYRS
jgi:hypothetical protein